MPMDLQFLKRRVEALRSERSSIEEVWDQVDRFILPLGGARTSRAADDEHAVEWKRYEVWDFTAIDGNQKLAANIHGSVTSPAIRWFRLTFRDKDLQNDNDAQAWLDKVGDIVFDALQDSDFNTEIAVSYQELTGAGTMCIAVEPLDEATWKGLDFTGVPIREVFYEPDSRGGVYRWYRSLWWTPVQIVERFKDKVPEHIKAKAMLPSGAVDKMEVVYAIWCRDEYKGMKKEAPLPPDRRPYGSTYFLMETADRLGEEGGFYEMPVFVVPWEKTANSKWGHGPGIIALPTVKYLNAVMQLVKNAMAKAVDPPLGVTQRGILSDLDMRPGKQTVALSKDDIFPLTPANHYRFDVAQLDINDLRNQVRSIFKTDELQLKDSPQMTATEVQVRYELMNRVLGSTLARLTSDCLSPMILGVVAILFRANQLPVMPPQVRSKGGAFSIEYQGPLSRAQRTDEVAAIERLASYVAALKKMEFREVDDIFDAVMSVRNIAKRLGVPADTLLSEAEVKQRSKERRVLMAQMAKAEAMRATGEAVQQGAEAAQAAAAVPPSVQQPASPPPVVVPPFQKAG
jgi:hypothetical protein